MKTKRAVFVMIVLVLFFALFTRFYNHTGISKDSTVVNKIELESKHIYQNKKKQGEKLFSKDAKRQESSDQDVAQSKEMKFSYLSLYQYFKLAQQCEPLLKVLKHKNGEIEGLIDALQDSILSNSRGRQNVVSNEQKDIMLVFADDCINLKESIKDFEESPSLNGVKSIAANIRLEMKKTKAVTAEEKELKEVLLLIESLVNLRSKIWTLNQGEQTLTLVEQKEIRGSIDKLNDDLWRISLNHPDDYLENEEFNLLSDALEKKEKFWKDHIQVNKKSLTNEIHKFILKQKKLASFLKTSFASVFNAIYENIKIIDTENQNYIYKNKWVKVDKLLFFKSRIAEELRYTDKLYFGWVFALAVDFYGCYLGADCTQDSIIMRNYCLGQFERVEFYSVVPVYKEACGSTVEDFYLQYFISPNQLEDVNQVFEYLVGSYAK